jgi:hypothetical protein
MGILGSGFLWRLVHAMAAGLVLGRLCQGGFLAGVAPGTVPRGAWVLAWQRPWVTIGDFFSCLGNFL